MKKVLFLSMLAGAAVMAGCSSDDAVAPENGGNQYGMVAGQPAFISVGIAMPNTGSTRANDDYNDGVAAEYAVKSGKLVLFKGTSVETAKLFESYDIPTTVFNLETGSTAVTSTSATFVQPITAPELTKQDKLYAYVILNHDGNATGISFAPNQTYETFSGQVLEAIGIADESKGYGAENTTNGFVMTSVPYSPVAAGSAAPATTTKCTSLYTIDSEAVYPTKAEASAASAKSACIYVERAAVKVDVTFNGGIADPAGSSVEVKLLGWGLGNTNNSASGYYNVRKVDDSWLQLTNLKCADADKKFRFASVGPFFASDHAMGYRTYWGQDVNYDGKAGLVNPKMADADYALASGATTYTYENTFDENSQIYANTTYVGFKTKLNNGADFYTIEGARNTALDETSLKNKLALNVDAQISATINTIKSTITAAINANLAALGATSSVGYTLAHEVTLGGRDASTGKVSYTDKLVIKDIIVDGAADDSKLADIKALDYDGSKTIGQKLDEALTGYTADVVYKYVNGVTYYATRIAHFGKAETPWTTDESSYNDYDKIYPMDGQSLDETSVNYGASRKAAWLGRWGILRNNWYSLTVENIVGIGDAAPVDYSDTTSPDSPGNTPDDNPKPKYYISAHIHILPWVKRTQDVIL